MTVKELIEDLQKQNQDALVFVDDDAWGSAVDIIGVDSSDNEVYIKLDLYGA